MYLAETPKTVAQHQNALCNQSSLLQPVDEVSQSPFRWVCRVLVETRKGHSVASAVLISPFHALTAAHVIYPLTEPYQTLKITVFPHYTPDWHTQFESDGWAVSPNWRAADCMTNGYDWGLIRLKKAVPASTGFWRMTSFNPTNLPNTLCRLAGYRRHKRLDPEAEHMFQSSGYLRTTPLVRSCNRTITDDEDEARESVQAVTVPVTNTSQLILHDAASLPSMSGGPVWIDSATLAAIHVGVIGNGQCRKAVLLTSGVQSAITGLMNGAMRPLHY